MEPDLNLCRLIQLGGVYHNVKGATPDSIYNNLSTLINLPTDLDPKILAQELGRREALLSTAVGNGIAIPHAQHPLIKNNTEQRIAICYLNEPIAMNAPDGRFVYVLFVLLTSTVQSHLQLLSGLARLFQVSEFRKMLEAHGDEPELIKIIREIGA